MTPTVTATLTSRGTFWAFFPAVLLASLVAFQLFMVRRILSDPSFAIEDQYYAKATSWNAHMARERESARLGWRTSVTVSPTADGEADFALVLLDRNGHAVLGASIAVDAFAIARSGRVLHGALTEAGNGEYHARLPMTRVGRWELSLEATRGAEHFSTVARLDLEPPASR